MGILPHILSQRYQAKFGLRIKRRNSREHFQLGAMLQYFSCRTIFDTTIVKEAKIMEIDAEYNWKVLNENLLDITKPACIDLNIKYGRNVLRMRFPAKQRRG